MVKVNLLPKEDLDKKAIGKFLKWTLSYGRYIIISVEMVVFLVFFSRFRFDQQLADLNDEIEQKQAIVASAADFEQRVRTIQKRIEQVKTLNNGRTIYLTVLARLKEITPVEMVFTELTFDKEELIITGQANTNESFAKFFTTLKTDALFSEIILENVEKQDVDTQTQKTQEDAEKVVEFTIIATVEGYQDQEPIPTIPVTIEEQNDAAN